MASGGLRPQAQTWVGGLALIRRWPQSSKDSPTPSYPVWRSSGHAHLPLTAGSWQPG